MSDLPINDADGIIRVTIRDAKGDEHSRELDVFLIGLDMNSVAAKGESQSTADYFRDLQAVFAQHGLPPLSALTARTLRDRVFARLRELEGKVEGGPESPV